MGGREAAGFRALKLGPAVDLLAEAGQFRQGASDHQGVRPDREEGTMTTPKSSPVRLLLVVTILSAWISTGVHAAQFPPQPTLRVEGERVSVVLRDAGAEGETQVFEIRILMDGRTKYVRMQNRTKEPMAFHRGSDGLARPGSAGVPRLPRWVAVAGGR